MFLSIRKEARIKFDLKYSKIIHTCNAPSMTSIYVHFLFDNSYCFLFPQPNYFILKPAVLYPIFITQDERQFTTVLWGIVVLSFESEKSPSIINLDAGGCACLRVVVDQDDLAVVVVSYLRLLSRHHRLHQRQLRTWQKDRLPQKKTQHRQRRRKIRPLLLGLAGTI